MTDPFIFYRSYWHRDGWCVGLADENTGVIEYIEGPFTHQCDADTIVDKLQEQEQ